jgi:hypothetical protein
LVGFLYLGLRSIDIFHYFYGWQDYCWSQNL